MRTLKRTMATLAPRRIATLAERADKARRPSQSITDRQKLRAWIKQAGRCKCCEIVVALTDADLDHVAPLVSGGGVGDDNVQVLCRPCHRAKTDAEITARARQTSRRIDVRTERNA